MADTRSVFTITINSLTGSFPNYQIDITFQPGPGETVDRTFTQTVDGTVNVLTFPVGSGDGSAVNVNTSFVAASNTTKVNVKANGASVEQALPDV